MIRNLAPILIILVAAVVGISAIAGSDGYLRLPHQEARLRSEQEKIEELKNYVNDLKVSVWDLQHEDRELERAARNEQGLARLNELVYIFDNK